MLIKNGFEPKIPVNFEGKKDVLNLEFMSIREQIKKNTKFRLA